MASSRRRRRVPAGRCPPRRRISASVRESVAGLAGQAEVLVELHPHGQRGILRQPPALVADEDERVFVTRRGQDEECLLEAWVEAGQVAQVGAVLAVGVDDEAVVAAFGGACPRSFRA